MATILLVDDEKILRTLMSVALRRGNHTVIEARGGRRALAAARKQTKQVDLLISELALPAMSALDLVRKLAEEHPRLPALFLSRSPHPAKLEERARAEGYTVLRQPFDMPTLLAETARLLDLPEGTRKPAARSEGENEIHRSEANGHLGT
jgi:DNA-binding NtrC family response regulator